jgi:AraC family transcriptional regulator
VNSIEGGPYAVFPKTAVVIQHLGRQPVLATPNHVIFYNQGQLYRRDLRDPRGDHCIFVTFRPALFEQLLGGREAIPYTHGPSSADAYLAQHAAVRHLRAETRPDQLLVEESLCHALTRVVTDTFELETHRRSHRPVTERAHHELVEATKALLLQRLARSVRMSELARDVCASEFHLARVFRAVTGFSLHGYRNQLRLRLALERLDETDAELRGLAADLGYASHSHFTDAFRHAFGVPPSAVRALSRRDRDELRLRSR